MSPLDNYPIGAKEHLRRAGELYNAGGVANLLYAALEIRLGAETRQGQYVAAWDHIPKRYRDNYRLTEVGRALEQAFTTGDKVIFITQIWDAETQLTFRFAPVSRELRRVCEQFGNYLHSPGWRRSYPAKASEWQASLKDLVTTGLIHLNIATTSELLGPGLKTQNGDETSIAFKMEVDKDYAERIAPIMQSGRRHTMQLQSVDLNDLALGLRQRLAVDNPGDVSPL